MRAWTLAPGVRFLYRARAGPGNTCPIPRGPRLEREREENWFFRLSAFEDDLKRLYAERPDFVVPEHRRNEALSFIEQGLEDVSLSRPKLKWGCRCPGIRASACTSGSTRSSTTTRRSRSRATADLTERYWPANRHVLGKDILKFHAVIWPAMLIAAGLEPPRGMVIHGFLLMGEKKMSKSLGNVLDPNEVIDRFGPTRCASIAFARSPSARTAASRRPGSRPATRASSPTTGATSRAGRSR